MNPPHVSTAARTALATAPAPVVRRVDSLGYRIGSRALDVVVSLALLIAAAPLLAGVGLAIWLESPGPIVYRDPRTGRRGRRFTMYKFRTMQWGHPAAARAGQRVGEDYQKPRQHQALTRIGFRLRQWSLDEIPNLFSVLRGDLALVGPRPTGWATDSYGEARDEILSVKPGVTGLWQVMGRGDVPFARRIALDLEYVRTRSLLLDLWILARTVPAVLSRRGAY